MLKSLVCLTLLAITNAADILTFKITDFQGKALDLSSPKPLTPVQSSSPTSKESQKWLFIYAMHGDENEYRVINAVGSSILSYATAPGPGYHAAIVGNQNVSTNWDVLNADKPKGSVNFIEKKSRLAMTASPAGNGKDQNSGGLTLEVYDAHNVRQVFKLSTPPV